MISLSDKERTLSECKNRLFHIVELASSASLLDDHLCLLELESVLVRCFQQVQQDENPGLDPRLSQVISWCAEHLQEGIGVEDMARVSGMSVSRFSHLFAEQVGETPRNYIEKERMVLARRMLLMSDLPIRAVAQAVGFSSEFHFSNRFRKLNGTSPTAYRQSRGM